MTVAVVGDLALDVVVRHDIPIAVGGDTPARVHTAPGGSAAATARGLARCGTDPVLITRVGDDPPGRDLVAGLRADGVRCATVVDPTAATGCVVVLVDAGGERTMLPDRGANAMLRPEDIALPGDAVHLHLSGYVLLDPRSRPAGLAALAAARDRGMSTSVDPASAPLLRAAGSTFVDWIAGVDLLLPNADEYAVLGADVLGAVGAVAVTEGAAGRTG